ncbi:MAG: cobaltochelatase subunit CobN [Bermanella sp.]
MHLFAATPGGYIDDEGIVDLDQSPADIIILSAADSNLSALAAAAELLGKDFPSVRLANWMHLVKPAAFDLYEQQVLDSAKVVVVSLLGGAAYWQYGFEQLQAWAARTGGTLILVPGDDSPDEELFNASTVSGDLTQMVWRYLREGGLENSQQLFYFIAEQFLQNDSLPSNFVKNSWLPPKALPNCILYMPESLSTSTSQTVYLKDWQQVWRSLPVNKVENQANKALNHTCIVLFYRSHLQSANIQMFDDFIQCLLDQGLKPLPVAVTSLKDESCLMMINELIVQSNAKLIVNTTGFSINITANADVASQPTRISSPFVQDIATLQVILCSSTEEDWQSYSQGLRSRDIAMHVVLPEMDGRIISRAVSFKSESHYSDRCQTSVVRYVLKQERAVFVAKLAKRYCTLASKENKDKRIAFILANYPTKDGRIGNGVGLDTPASTINLLNSLENAQYPVENIPEDGTALIKALLTAVTNNPNTLHYLPCWQSIAMDDYMAHFKKLPIENQKQVWEKWGAPSQDPKCRNERLMVAGIRLGETFVGIQPARGFNLDLTANYHDPDLVPPHSYLAFYFWLSDCYGVDAVVHVGKHGNLEWLPGKGTALSINCWPDIALGPMPNFYPFIVNDPGEGAQAKRRTQATVIDHLMPPMTRSETYGELAELEILVDEYYQALGLDKRRENWLKDEIIDLLKASNVLQELIGIESPAQSESESKAEKKNEITLDEAVLNQLDTYLCEIKEAQIRHGLHIQGQLPNADKLADTLVALLRLPRGKNILDQGILHNLAFDLNLKVGNDFFDPLMADASIWLGDKPAILKEVSTDVWRSQMDTRERLECLAQKWMMEFILEGVDFSHLQLSHPRSFEQLHYVKNTLMSALNESAHLEIQSLLDGLDGKLVPPGPSGAPTRGRLDTLPTGRNFFSVDNRAIPSKAAWALGKKSAQALIERHLQEHGDYPSQLGLSVWGTATMRTGGDDIAQAFALMGVKPIWAQGSARVVDFEITPTMLLQRPRVDVTLRVSGFFRDAFPNVMRIYDSAVQALAKLEEPGFGNTIYKNVQIRKQQLISEGMDEASAFSQASYRVFGSKPGAYGAGLQGLIDERCWEKDSDLSDAYLNWGGYAYGSDKDGVEARGEFQHRLSQVEVVVQNQDNREHDLLDSDDYYQFQGGMTNAVNVLSGKMPAVYHGDHSNPHVPKIRTLKEELNRVIRSRVLNPKWITAMREHGYKGAFEMAASIDYLFAYDATTQLIDDYQYKQVADALVFDETNQAFLKEHNLPALEEMAERLLEAKQRGLWGAEQTTDEYKGALQDLLLEIDQEKEQAL